MLIPELLYFCMIRKLAFKLFQVKLLNQNIFKKAKEKVLCENMDCLRGSNPKNNESLREGETRWGSYPQVSKAISENSHIQEIALSIVFGKKKEVAICWDVSYQFRHRWDVPQLVLFEAYNIFEPFSLRKDSKASPTSLLKNQPIWKSC